MSGPPPAAPRRGTSSVQHVVGLIIGLIRLRAQDSAGRGVYLDIHGGRAFHNLNFVDKLAILVFKLRLHRFALGVLLGGGNGLVKRTFAFASVASSISSSELFLPAYTAAAASAAAVSAPMIASFDLVMLSIHQVEIAARHHRPVVRCTVPTLKRT